MTAAFVLIAVVALALAAWRVLRARRRRPSPGPTSAYADAPPALGDAKRAFESANAKLLAAQQGWRTAAAEVDATGKAMTAAYQAWATGRAATALELNGGRRASVFERLERAEELLSRPVRPAEQ